MNIDFSVLLPMYQSKLIGWLPLESLCRQEGLENLYWELIIVEEEGPFAFGADRVEEYEDRLREIGCVRIVYMALDTWIPLAVKWRMLAQLTTDNSIGAICQGSDNYSYPQRLHELYDALNTGVTWVRRKIVPFYVVATQEIIIADYEQRAAYLKKHSKASTPHVIGAGMGYAINLKWMRQLPKEPVKKGVDRWLYKTMQEFVGAEFTTHTIDTDLWRGGFNTHGFGNISKKRYAALKMRYNADPSLVADWPKDIMERLRTLGMLAHAKRTKDISGRNKNG